MDPYAGAGLGFQKKDPYQSERLSRTNNPAATTEHKPRQTEQSGQSGDATRVSISYARRQHAEAVTQSWQTQRAETLRAIREQIEDGVYWVDAKDVAWAILQIRWCVYTAFAQSAGSIGPAGSVN